MTRRILVTGANKGIGLAVVNRCLQDHADTLGQWADKVLLDGRLD